MKLYLIKWSHTNDTLSLYLSVYISIYLVTTMLYDAHRLHRFKSPVLCKFNQSKLPINISVIFVFKIFLSIQIHILNLKAPRYFWDSGKKKSNSNLWKKAAPAVKNMFKCNKENSIKVKNKDTWTKLVISFWCLSFKFEV